MNEIQENFDITIDGTEINVTITFMFPNDPSYNPADCQKRVDDFTIQITDDLTLGMVDLCRESIEDFSKVILEYVEKSLSDDIIYRVSQEWKSIYEQRI